MTDIPPPGPPPEESTSSAPQEAPTTAPPSPGWQQPGWQQPGYGAAPQWGTYPPPPKTSGLAIASLILGLAWLIVGPLGFFTGIAAVITGHKARKRIPETGEKGAGMALAGLILGYVSIAMSVIGTVVAAVLFFSVIPNFVQDDVEKSAREFGDTLVASNVGTPRSAELIQDLYQRQLTFGNIAVPDDDDCCDDTIRLADGTHIARATKAAFERNDWKLEFSSWWFGDKYACLTVPETNSDPVIVTEGRCSD